MFYIVSTVEPIPIIDGDVTAWRSVRFAKICQEVSDTTLLISSFDHYTKSYRNKSLIPEFERVYGIRLEFIPSIGYVKNISIKRVLNYWLQTLWLCLYFFKNSARADKLLITVPPVEHLICLRFFKGTTAYDYRDLWPQIFEDNINGGLTSYYLSIYVRALRKILIWGYQKVPLVFTISEGFKKELLTYCGARTNKVQIIPHHRSMNLTNLSPSKVTTQRLADSNIIYAGKITSRTNVATTIEKFFLNHQFKGKIYICGGGDDDELKRIERLSNISPRIFYLGYLSAGELLEIYKKCSYGLIPYDNLSDFSITLPNKFFEYLSNGLFITHDNFKPIEDFSRQKPFKIDVNLSNFDQNLAYSDILKAQRFVEDEYAIKIDKLKQFLDA